MFVVQEDCEWCVLLKSLLQISSREASLSMEYTSNSSATNIYKNAKPGKWSDVLMIEYDWFDFEVIFGYSLDHWFPPSWWPAPDLARKVTLKRFVLGAILGLPSGFSSNQQFAMNNLEHFPIKNDDFLVKLQEGYNKLGLLKKPLVCGENIAFLRTFDKRSANSPLLELRKRQTRKTSSQPSVWRTSYDMFNHNPTTWGCIPFIQRKWDNNPPI